MIDAMAWKRLRFWLTCLGVLLAIAWPDRPSALSVVFAGGGRIAMEHNFSVAVGDGARVAMILPGRGSRGYAMELGPRDLTPLPAADPDMLRRTIAIIQTAHRMFYGRLYHELSAEHAAGPAVRRVQAAALADR